LPNGLPFCFDGVSTCPGFFAFAFAFFAFAMTDAYHPGARPMNSHAATALRHPCLLAIETIHPRYNRKDTRTGYSITLTVNSGYE
jgi:hypothetical protein